MADWNKPSLSDTYADFLDLLDAKIEDIATFFYNAPTNTVQYSMRFNRSTNVFQEWDSGWSDKLLAILGGGTGASTASGARTNLGLGTMATQANNAVSITGGSIAVGTLMQLSCDLTFGSDDSYDIGSNATRPSKAYIRSALVIPVGTDKYATS